MSVMMDIVNELDDLREIDGVEKLKEKLNCVSVTEYTSNAELKERFPLYTDYLRQMYNDYVDDEELKRKGMSKHDILLIVDRTNNKDVLKPFMSEIGIDGFPYCTLGYKKENSDTLAGYRYGITIANPEKFSDSKPNIEILKENAFAHIRSEEMDIIESAIANDDLVKIEPRFVSRKSSKPYDVNICVRIITK